MSTALFTHPSCILHDNGPGHPESPDRLKAILAELDKPDYKNLQRLEAPQATIDQIARVHGRNYVENILKRVPAEGFTSLDPDTSLSPASGEAALRAAGALCAAIDHVMNSKSKNAFCAVRPPGHHAEQSTAMGFCLFNNIAIGAAHALDKHNLQRIAIIDFDVHHGNGTQEWVETEQRVFFCSSHQYPLYPGTGAAVEKGQYNNILNTPLSYGADGEKFRAAMENFVLPAIDRFQPEIIMISAGFDAHRDDPLAGLNFTEDDYAWITRELMKLADKFCQSRIVSTLEGGYDLNALSLSTGAHVKALMAI